MLQVLNKREGVFTARDEEFIRVLAEQIGRAIDYTTLRGDDEQRGLQFRGLESRELAFVVGVRQESRLWSRSRPSCRDSL